MNNETHVRTISPIPCTTLAGDGECGNDANLLIVARAFPVGNNPTFDDPYPLRAQAICQSCVAGMLQHYMPDDLITITEAATLLDCTTINVSNMIRSGKLFSWVDPDENNPQRSKRVSRADVEKLLYIA